MTMIMKRAFFALSNLVIFMLSDVSNVLSAVFLNFSHHHFTNPWPFSNIRFKVKRPERYQVQLDITSNVFLDLLLNWISFLHDINLNTTVERRTLNTIEHKRNHIFWKLLNHLHFILQTFD